MSTLIRRSGSAPGGGGGGGGGGERFTMTGNVAVVAGKHRVYNDTGAARTIKGARATVGVAPAGAAILVDVNLDGVTIYTTQTARPTIAAAGFTSGLAAPAVTSWPAGSYLTVDVDQIGSTTPGAELVVQVEVQ